MATSLTEEQKQQIPTGAPFGEAEVKQFQADYPQNRDAAIGGLSMLNPIAEKAVDSAGDSSLTSSPARTYVAGVGKTVSDRQKQIEADALASDQKLADLNRIMGQQSSNLIENQLKAAEVAQKPLKDQFAITAERTAASRKESEATQQAAAFRMQQTATPYAEAATAKRARAYELDDKQRGMREAELLNQAWDQALRGEINISQRLLGEAQTAMQERQRIRDDARAEQEMTMKLAEYEDTRALKAQDRAMSTVQNLVSAGFTVDQLPDSYLNELDTQAGMPKGFSSQIFQTTKSAQEALVIQDAEERKAKELDNASKLVSILDKVPAGQAVQIGEATYYGTSRGDIKSGTEIDANGNGTYWEFDPVTKRVQTHSLGAIGKAQDGWETKTDDQGRMWFVNPSTRQTQPAFPSEGQKALEDIIPDGAVWQRDGVDAPECGQFVNDLTGAGVGDSYESKIAKIDSSIKAGTDNPPRYGDFFVQSTSTWTGHAGIVVGSEVAPNGETYIFTKESNYPKSGVINSRRIKASEVAGFGRTGQIAEGLMVGSDKPTFGKKKEEIEGRKLESSQAKLLAEGKNLNNVLNPLDTLLNRKDLFGPVVGRARGLNPYDTEAQDAQARLKRATQVIGSYLEGGVLRKEDEEKYRKMLPQLTDTNAVAEKKLAGVRNLVKLKQEEYIESFEKAGYNISEFKGEQAQTIRVRRKSDGATGSVLPEEFDSNIYERL